MKVKMKLLSDTIFGNGQSIPGAEDIAVLHDRYGFPYYKGGTFKGIFREMLIRCLEWKGEADIDSYVNRLLGYSGNQDPEQGTVYFSDFILADPVKKAMISSFEKENESFILNCFTHTRAFTALTEEGLAKEGSLRIARCVNRGINLWAEISCRQEDEELVKEVLSMIQWIGSMRNRGFGHVTVSVEE